MNFIVHFGVWKISCQLGIIKILIILHKFSFLGGVVGVGLTIYLLLGEFRTAEVVIAADIVILLVKNALGWLIKLEVLPCLISNTSD